MGTSKLQEDMAVKGGYEKILNVDISTVAVKHMAEQHRDLPQLQYKVADAR